MPCVPEVQAEALRMRNPLRGRRRAIGGFICLVASCFYAMGAALLLGHGEWLHMIVDILITALFGWWAYQDLR